MMNRYWAAVVNGSKVKAAMTHGSPTLALTAIMPLKIF